ncbi:MAG TPA: hypothetical protein VMV98_09340 [Acidobacteriaceae bacterium]|nr:hypothetical protein [Acidobacteriaceae bacterium]
MGSVMSEEINRWTVLISRGVSHNELTRYGSVTVDSQPRKM